MRPDTKQRKLATARRNLAFTQNLLRTCPMEMWRVRMIAEQEERRLMDWIKEAERKQVAQR